MWYEDTIPPLWFFSVSKQRAKALPLPVDQHRTLFRKKIRAVVNGERQIIMLILCELSDGLQHMMFVNLKDNFASQESRSIRLRKCLFTDETPNIFFYSWRISPYE